MLRTLMRIGGWAVLIVGIVAAIFYARDLELRGQHHLARMIGWTMVLIPSAGVTYAISLVRWRASKGRCLSCGYDPRGQAGRCPSCGGLIAIHK